MDGEVLDFGTTGLLRFSNLVMYDRQTESWWQEFSGEAVVGDMTGTKLEILPNSIVSWGDFKKAHPDGKVLSKFTGFFRPYGQNPYAFYDTYNNPFGRVGPRDPRLPAMERVAAVIVGDESLAVPFSVLETEPVVHYTLGGRELVVFFKKGTASPLDNSNLVKGRDIGAVGVFDPHLDGTELSFGMQDGKIVDQETGSVWNLLGQAVSGPQKGKILTPIAHRGQFWFSWVVYEPDTIIYQGEGKTSQISS